MQDNTKNHKAKSKKLRPAKKITLNRLQNIAIHYLERFGGTEKSLRDVLQKRIRKSMADHPEQNIDEINQWVESVVQKCKEYNYINDENFAKSRAKSLQNRGNSIKMIIAKLKQKGINDTDIKTAIDELDGDGELMSAINYAQKRRFGIYSPDWNGNINEKHLSAMARRGFSYEISKKALTEQQ